MATPVKYKPSQKVSLGPGKDTLNDFARKYNLALEEIFSILNLRSARQVYFKADSIHWVEVDTDEYTLTIPHNGNAVFAVYATDYDEGVSTLVSAGVSMDSTNVTVEAEEPFDGFMLYAGLNDGAGLGSNLSDDVIAQLIEDTRAEFYDHLTDAENFAEADTTFYKVDDTEQTTPHHSAKYYADSAESTYNVLVAANTQAFLDQVIEMLQGQTSVLSSGYWEPDVFGNLMPRNTAESDENWETDTNGDLMPTVPTESEGD